MARIEVDARTYRELELIALAWNTTVGDALARLIADFTDADTNRADRASVLVRQEGKRTDEHR